jgi:hypothetical protein
MKQKITTALISVSDKSDLSKILKTLNKYKVKIISSGGTYKSIKKLGYTCTEVSAYTGFKEMLDGRVKTLHPKIHAGILHDRSNKKHSKEMNKKKFPSLDLIIVNFYPFQKIVANSRNNKEIIENIDIGGPTMVRSAAKNFKNVLIVTNKNDYSDLVKEIEKNNGKTTLNFREYMSSKAFGLTAYYDAMIANWFNQKLNIKFPERKTIFGRRFKQLRYGENPHQKSSIYINNYNDKELGLSQLGGKDLSYNNYNDRFTFGINELTEGIGFIPVVVGLFAISELLTQSTLLDQVFKRVALKAIKLPSMSDYKLTWKTILRSSGIGSFIGVLPAEGGTVASLIGYSEAKRWSKNPEEFGKGSIEGIAGAEAANNAATGGAMVPTLALGIPGSATTAVILTGLIIHGVRPGPDLFRDQPEFLYGIFGAMLISNVLFFIFGFFGAKLFARITLVPNKILWPMIFALSVCGTYSLNQSIIDIWIMLFFGIVGFFMRRYGFSVVPVIIGLILGELVEGTLRQSLVIFDGNWLMFFTRPIALTFFILAFIALAFPLLKRK